MFSVGDKVVMAVDVETAEKLQDGHGGWNDSMEDVSLPVRVLFYHKIRRKFPHQPHTRNTTGQEQWLSIKVHIEV